MSRYELCFGTRTLSEVIDQMAFDANAVAPGLGFDRVRALIELMFRTRTRQTESCGRYAECDPERALWGRRPPPTGAVRPCGFSDADPYDLPNIFAASAADLLEPGVGERDALEDRLASVFRGTLATLVFENDHCGKSGICLAARSDPFAEIRK